jgi:hypothetical protein
MASTLINVPAKARRGDIIEIKTLMSHIMETGYRHMASGEVVPRDIITSFTCRFNGTEIFRAVDPPIWTWAWNQKAQDHDVVAPDMRFPNEMEIINARGGVCIHVSRPGQEPTSGHVSETSLDDVEFDYVVVNDGDLEHLWDVLVGILDTYANECGDDVDTEYAKLLTA